MKKIIAISVMFALFAGAVFAETSVSGGVETRFSVSGDTGKTDGGNAVKPTMKGEIGTANIKLSGKNDDGTLGGAVKLRGEDIIRGGSWSGTINATKYSEISTLAGTQTASISGSTTSGAWVHTAYVWWQPISQVKIFLGIDQDGMFGTDPLTSWGYHRGSEGFINNHDWDFWRMVFPGNWDGFGLAFSLYPVDGLDINLVIPTGGTSWPQATGDQIGKNWRVDEMLVAGLRLNINYAIPDVGKLMLTYIGANAYASTGNPANQNSLGFADSDADKQKVKTNGMFGASFLLTMVEGFQIQPGISMVLANTSNWKANGDDAKSLIYAGLGVHYTADAFGVKARVAYLMNGGPGAPTGVDYYGSKDVSHMRFSVMPWYAMESLTVFCDIGANMTMVKDSDAAVEFFVNPYVTVPISGGKFQAGLKINNFNKYAGDKTTWSVPMLLGFNF
jgi:hypothetical protein